MPTMYKLLWQAPGETQKIKEIPGAHSVVEMASEEHK